MIIFTSALINEISILFDGYQVNESDFLLSNTILNEQYSVSYTNGRFYAQFLNSFWQIDLN